MQKLLECVKIEISFVIITETLLILKKLKRQQPLNDIIQ